MEEEKIHCPKCNSTQLTANTKGYSGGKAVAGAVLTGGIGLLAGLHGKGKIIITCMSCGEKWKPGEHIEKKKTIQEHHEINNRGKYREEFMRLYLVDKVRAEEFARNKNMLNIKIKNIHSLYQTCKEERIMNYVLIVLFVAIIIFFIYQCAN